MQEDKPPIELSDEIAAELIKEIKLKNNRVLDLELKNYHPSLITILESHLFYQINLSIFNLDIQSCAIADGLKKQLKLKRFNFYFGSSSSKVENTLLKTLFSQLNSLNRLTELEIHHLKFDLTHSSICDLFKENYSLENLQLNFSQVDDQLATKLIQIANYKQKFKYLELIGNNLTSAIVPVIMSSHLAININADQLPGSILTTLKRRYERKLFMSAHQHRFFLFKLQQASAVFQFNPTEMREFKKLIYLKPEAKDQDIKSPISKFTETPTSTIYWSKFFKRQRQFYGKLEEEKVISVPTYKDIIICGSTGYFLSIPIEKIFYWTGDPNHLETERTENFKPAQADEVIKLLEKSRPEYVNHCYVIDDTVFKEIIRNSHLVSLLKETGRHMDENFNLSIYPSSDEFFKKILPSIPRRILTLTLHPCDNIPPSTILQALPYFPNIENLILWNKQHWGDELAQLTEICPNLITLSIIVNTTKYLQSFSKFHFLKDLKLIVLNDYETKDLDFLSDLREYLTILKLDGCTNLADFWGLRSCNNLEELSLENMKINDIEHLIDTLAPLKKLKLLVLHDTQFSISDAQIETLKTLLPNVWISTHGESTEPAAFNECKKMDKAWLKSHAGQDTKVAGLIPIETTETLACYNAYIEPQKRNLTSTQIFLDSKTVNLSAHEDRYTFLDLMQIKPDHHIVFTTSETAQQNLDIYSNVKFMPFEKMDTELLKQLESKTPQTSCLGQRRLTLYSFQWTPVPSRYVLSKPEVCSEKLLWARSPVTGALYARLPQKSLDSKSVLLRYILTEEPNTHQRHMAPTPLPEDIQNVFKKLIENPTILTEFPKFKQFIQDMEEAKGELARFNVIKGYCQISKSGSGFTDAPFNEGLAQIILNFIHALKVEPTNFADDLYYFFNTLLQQKAVCEGVSRSAKFLCDYYGLRCHVIMNPLHVFVDYAFQENQTTIIDTQDLGGGEAHVVITPLEQPKLADRLQESKDSKHPSSAAKLNKEQTIHKTLKIFKPVRLYGQDCCDFKSYFKLITTEPNPMVLLNQSSDADNFLAGFREECLQQGMEPNQLFYISRADQLSELWDAVCIEDGRMDNVPGWLKDFLTEKPKKTPRFLIFDVSEFDSDDLTSHQGIGDAHPILQDLSLSTDVKAIFLATEALTRRKDTDIFSSRFTPIQYRDDLFAEFKPISCFDDSPPASENSEVIHFYHDPVNHTKCLGKQFLENKKPQFEEGPLGLAILGKKDVTMTDLPDPMAAIAFLMKYTGQVPINSKPRKVSDIKFYQTKHSTPESKFIQFVTKPKEFLLFLIYNPYTSPLFISSNLHIDPKDGSSHASPPVLDQDQLTEMIIIFTQSVSYATWCEFVDNVDQRRKNIKIYLCPGVKIYGTGHRGPSKTSVPEEFKTIAGSCIIESISPEDTLAALQKTGTIEAENVLTLTSSVSLELLTQITRKGESFDFHYQPGWLLSKLSQPDNKNPIILIGEMESELFYALEPYFSSQAYLHTNEGLQKFDRPLIWIKRPNGKNKISNIVKYCQHNPEPRIIEEEKTAPPVPSYQKRIDLIQQFIFNDKSDSIFLELFGPPGAGKTTSIGNAIKNIRSQGKMVQQFLEVENYVDWRKEHKEDKETICILQLDDCRLSPTGQLEFLRDITRNNQFYWRGAWYPGLKVIMTNNRESDPRNQKHPFFTDYRIPSSTFNPLTETEINDYILTPFLENFEDKGLNPKTILNIGKCFLLVYDKVAKLLPYTTLSTRDLLNICQRFETLLNIHPREGIFYLGAKACYEELFGLFEQENERDYYWEFLLKTFEIRKELRAFYLHSKLEKFLEGKGLLCTKQCIEIGEMIQRLCDTRKINQGKNYPGKCGLLLEGPPGILKTELSLVILEHNGFTPAPAVADGKKNHYLNLIAIKNSDLLEKQICLADQEGWIVVCNEINRLQESTIKLLMKLLEAPKNGLCVIATLNHYLAGSGRQPLLPAFRNRFQIMYLRDYNEAELSYFAKKYHIYETKFVASMYKNLVYYQTLNDLPVANPRHYFRWLRELAKVSQQECTITKMTELLFKITMPPSQSQVLEFILRRIPAECYPTVRLSTTSHLRITSTPFPLSSFNGPLTLSF